jgi:hypothetical protein
MITALATLTSLVGSLIGFNRAPALVIEPEPTYSDGDFIHVIRWIDDSGEGIQVGRIARVIDDESAIVLFEDRAETVYGFQVVR